MANQNDLSALTQRKLEHKDCKSGQCPACAAKNAPKGYAANGGVVLSGKRF